MLITFLFAFLLLNPATNDHDTNVWGTNGHRIVGDIAADYLSPDARKAVDRVLGPTSMAIASTWMDRIKSDPAYDHTHSWHWVTIPDGMTYEETEKNPDGDLINTIRTIVRELKSGALNKQEEQENLKMLIHLIGDIHQPLHVGTGKDRGGNATEVEWFYEESNLHRVWDSEMIKDRKLSYTEFSTAINHPTDEQLKEWQDSGVLDWAKESMALREQVYDLPEDHQIGYEYQYENYDLLNRQLLKAGVRLAGVLNEIYGD
ncbi:S1/P1 nuclease [Fodinibius halophilus]|uniref:S1/P1 nuclease n=1 Tax=Fodinibius halophilus TaxID=1736908 RepID=A0A6M1SUI9_9BACT|nr:S1/P1 nuclease [Fodinibius halophilus]NGP87638.1 S1/P1 nuclease [Fodinibius halophilus]